MDGKIIFSPCGLVGKGYVLPYPDLRQEIKKKVRRFSITLVSILGLIHLVVNLLLVFIDLDSNLKMNARLICPILLIFFYLAGYNQYINRIMAGFEIITGRVNRASVTEKILVKSRTSSIIQLVIASFFPFVAFVLMFFLFISEPLPSVLVKYYVIGVLVIILLAFLWNVFLILIKIHYHFKK